jgi:hypothetical protein
MLAGECGLSVAGFFENTLNAFSSENSRRMWVLLQKIG